MTLWIVSLCNIMTLCTVSLDKMTLIKMTLNITALDAIYSEGRHCAYYAARHYGECHSAECRGARSATVYNYGAKKPSSFDTDKMSFAQKLFYSPPTPRRE
jgi:hypothetical protein